MTRRIRGSLTLLASTPARWLAGRAAALAGRTKGPRQTGQADRAGPRRARRPALLGLGLLLAGWLALRHLRDPKQALVHFQALAQSADGPLSRSKAHYWLGRTYEALGMRETAYRLYETEL